MTLQRNGTPKISSGFKDLQIMKTAQSGLFVSRYFSLLPYLKGAL
jgi:hypothetical protein